MSFRERDEWELDRLGDEELLAYVAAARSAGNNGAMSTALGIFAYRRYDDLVRYARLKVPTEQDAEDLAQQALEGVFKAAFDGTVPGEAVNFVYTVLRRRIADFTDRRKRRGGGDLPLPEERDDDDERAGPPAAIQPNFAPEIDLQDVIDQAKAELSAAHREVVDLYLGDGYDAKETAERVNAAFADLDPPMSDANVHQIARRYRVRLRELLDQ